MAARAAGAPSAPQGAPAPTILAAGADKPALLGGAPVRAKPFPSWPVIDGRDEKEMLDVLHGGKWFRLDGSTVDRFEEAYATRLLGRHGGPVGGPVVAHELLGVPVEHAHEVLGRAHRPGDRGRRQREGGLDLVEQLQRGAARPGPLV